MKNELITMKNDTDSFHLQINGKNQVDLKYQYEFCKRNYNKKLGPKKRILQ